MEYDNYKVLKPESDILVPATVKGCVITENGVYYTIEVFDDCVKVPIKYNYSLKANLSIADTNDLIDELNRRCPSLKLPHVSNFDI